LGWSLGLANTKKPSEGWGVNRWIQAGAAEKDEESIQRRRGYVMQEKTFKQTQDGG
jgi:hypothetical protein